MAPVWVWLGSGALLDLKIFILAYFRR